MEALSSSIILPAFQETHSSNRHPSLRTTLSFSKTTARLSAVAVAASRQVSGDSEDDQQQQQQQVLDLHNAFDGVIGKTISNEDLNKKTSADGKKGVIGQTNSNEDLNKKTSEDGKKGVIGQTNSNEDLNKKTSEVGTGGSTRAGLFRTPISGGVQSATSVHDLPKPALAVRNLMEQARFAHLSTVMSRMHQRSEGYPFGSLVDFAPDPMGHPIFSFSQLGIHTRNLLANPRCTLVVQIPGWSGLSNARVTIFGDVYPLAEDEQEWAHKQYIAKHQQAPSQQWGNFYYFRMHNISDIYFIGGFGTVAWVNVKEYEALQPDDIAVNGGEQNLKELNVMFSKPLKDLISLESQVDDVSLISIDSKGTDIRVRQGAQFHIQRLVFEEWDGIKTLEEAKAALWNLVNKGGVYTVHK